MEVRLSGKQNIFEEIASEYERYIRLGALREGEKLPSVRTLAMQLGVNPNTVERAYALLEQKGLVFTLSKKGVFVCAQKTEPPLYDEARRHVAALRSAGGQREEQISGVTGIYGTRGKR